MPVINTFPVSRHEKPAWVATSGEEMCKTISFYILQRSGVVMKPEAIWNLSPSGELWHVYEWYYQVTGAEVDPETGCMFWPDI